MTVSTINSVAEFVTNGVTKTFPFYFKFLDGRDLVVTYIDPEDVSTVLAMGTQYTASGAGNEKGGSVITTAVLRGPGKLIVFRDMEAYQKTSLRNQGKFLAETHEDVFDRLTMLSQQGFAGLKRALSKPFGREYFHAEDKRIVGLGDPQSPKDAATKDYTDDSATGVINYTDARLLRTVRSVDGETLTQLPAVSSRANKVMGFDANGQPIGVLPVSGSGTELAIDLANGVDPNKGVGMLAFPRTPVAAAKSSASRVMSALRVNIWEDQFVRLITNKPTANPSTWDWTPAFEAASLYVKANGGGVVELTEGVFSFTRIYRRNGVSIECRGSAATYMQALPFDPGSGKPYGLIEQEDGPVIGSHIRGVHLLGLPASNPNQWGMYLHAKWDSDYIHGGLWMSVHDDMRITYFNKGIWSRGGYTVAHYKRPQQFLDFRSVYVQVPTGGEPLRMTGQHGQVNFTLGSAEGRDGHTALRAVALSFDPDPSTTADNNSGNGESTADVSGIGNAVQTPINVTFGTKFSIQKTQEGVYAQGAKNIVISGIWGENIGKFLTMANNAHVEVEKSHLAKAANGAMFGQPGSGYLVSCQSNSTLVWRNDNNITGAVDSFTDPSMSSNNFSGVDIGLTFFNGDTTGKFKAAGYKSVGIDASGKIVLEGHKYAILSSNVDQTILLKTINANAAPGEQIMLKANSGPVTLGTGGNISLGTLPAVTIPQFGIAVFVRKFEVGSSGEWDLVSMPEHFGSGAPSSGYYAVGTKVWRSNPGPGSFMGVVCVTGGIAGVTAVFKNMPNLAT